MEKIKTIFFVSNDDSLLSFRFELIQKLVFLKHNVYCIFPIKKVVPSHLNSFNNVRFLNINFNSKSINPFTFLFNLITLKSYLIRLNPDLIFTYTIKPNIYMGLLSFFSKFTLVWTITGLGNFLTSKFYFLILQLYNLSIKNVKHIYFQNESIKDFFIKNISFKSSYSIIRGSGVNFSSFDRINIFSDFSLPIKVVFIGRLEIEKGIKLFSDLAYHFRKDSKFRFTIYGDSNNKHVVYKLATNNFLSYNGFAINVNKVLDSYHILINPSFHEGTSNIVLEAISKGLIVLGSDIPGIQEIINNKIYLFEKGNLTSLINKLTIIKEIFLENPQLVARDLNKQYRYLKRNYNRSLIVEDYMGHL